MCSKCVVFVLQKMTSKQSESAVTLSWHGVYCLCVDLYATALLVLKFSFLEDAFHFLGVHQDRMLQVQLIYIFLIVLTRKNNSYKVDFWWKGNDRWFLWMYTFYQLFMVYFLSEWFDMYLYLLVLWAVQGAAAGKCVVWSREDMWLYLSAVIIPTPVES